MKKMYRRRRVQRNEYLKTVFKDEEIYHAGFVDMKQGSQWKEITTWLTTNARFFKLPVMPYPLVGRFKELCAMYRWVKFNYISFYFDVSAYSYTGNSDMAIVFTEDVINPKLLYVCHKLSERKMLRLIVINSFNFPRYKKNANNEFLLKTIEY